MIIIMLSINDNDVSNASMKQNGCSAYTNDNNKVYVPTCANGMIRFEIRYLIYTTYNIEMLTQH